MSIATTHADLSGRLSFMELDARSSASIQSLKSLVDRELPIALDKFYQKLRATPEVRRFFDTDAQMTRAKSAQIGHWSAISSGNFDSQYVAKVRTIGLTHARIGLEPRWYIGGYAIIVEHLLTAILGEVFGKSGGWGSKRPDVAQVSEAVSSLVKAVLLDMDFAISVYIEAAEAARLEGEAEAKAQERAMVAKSFGAGIRKLAAKDLTYRITDQLPDAYRGLQDDFNSALQQMEQAIQGVNASAGSIRMGADEITSAADDLSKRTEQQAASLEQTAAALDEITATVKKAAESAAHARDVVASAKHDAERSGAVVKRTVDAMGGIEKSSQQISQIIGVIDEIAFQTNLLALNAGVEAARAGEAGRGFAVVASEVRALAQRSAEAAKEIKGLIQASSGQVEQGVQLVAETGSSLERIISQVTEINAVVTEIASGAQEQATSLQQVNTAINQMDQSTQQNAAMVEQSTAASHSLTREAVQLSDLVGEFSTSATSDARPMPRQAPQSGAASRAKPSRNPPRSRSSAALATELQPEAPDGEWKDF